MNPRKSKTPARTAADMASEASLFAQIRHVVLQARQRSYSAVNAAMVQAYWQIGRHIVEFEQAGQARANYGQRVLPELSKRLTQEFGTGFSQVNLKYFRQFYQCFPIGHTACDESAAVPNLPPLTWSHFRMLLAESEQVFASRYQPWLPTEDELRAELTRDRALLENAREADA